MAALTEMFQEYKGSKMAVYGLGTETERVLEEMDQEFQIIGLLDGYQTTGTVFEKPVISMERAVHEGVKLILVAARPGSCKAIAKRIGNICAENKIRLFDIRGKDLCCVQRSVYDFRDRDGITKQQLLRKIEEAEIVSFDLFDTLLMRRTLFSTDLFELVDCRLRKQGIFIEDFSEKRTRCEKELSKYGAPALTEIYSYMGDFYKLSKLNPQEAALLEWQIEWELIIPREDVCQVLKTAGEMGKTVYIVSDSYYTKQQIITLMKRYDITQYKEVLISSEYGTGKTQSLFRILREREGEKTYLHIGDDLIADVESAKRNGMEAIQLYSGIDLLEMCGYMDLWDPIDSLADRIRAGIFVSKILNSPFQFETDFRKISVSRAFDIGYLFFAPLITDFVIWFFRKVKQEQIHNVFFCARDGYLIKKLYDAISGSKESVYFLTSRTAAIRTGIEDEADLRYVENMNFSGTLEEQLRERFGIDVEGENKRTDQGSGGLLSYAKEILERVSINRRAYGTYIKGLRIKEGNIAFFDFVAKGTSQMYLERLLENHLKGFYFLQLDVEEMRRHKLDIEPFYGEEERCSSVIFDDYYILETILTAPTPSVNGFDNEGLPMYAEETREEESIRCIEDAQEGIKEYFETYLKICPESMMGINKRLDETFLSLIHKIRILEEDFLGLKVEDPFFNRTTNLVDLL